MRLFKDVNVSELESLGQPCGEGVWEAGVKRRQVGLIYKGGEEVVK